MSTEGEGLDPPHPDYSDGPERIVSLLPSITEILSSLGVSDRIVGVTHECDHPPDAVDGARIVTKSDVSPHRMTQEQIHEAVCGSLRNGQSLYGIDGDALRDVRPDVIFTQSLCDVCAVSYPVVLDACARLVGGPPPPPPPPSSSSSGDGAKTTLGRDGEIYPRVISMEPTNLADVLRTFHVAAEALGRPEILRRAEEVTSGIEAGLDAIRSAVGGRPRPAVAFVEWHSPIFAGGHWIPDMLDIAGGDCAARRSGERSAPMEDDEFRRLDPDVILIGPCGFSLDRSMGDTLAMRGERPWWGEMRAVRGGRVYALDGNGYFARPGPRLLQGTGIMAACIHGEDVAEALGEELAPSGGYIRIAADMYERWSSSSSSSSILDAAASALSADPPIASTRLRLHGTSLFVAWNGVIVLVFDGFPPPLVTAKVRLGGAVPDLKPEKFGSMWPKTTLAAEVDGVDPLSAYELGRLREICRLHSETIAADMDSTSLVVSSLSVVEYECRSLERLRRRIDVPLSGETDPSTPPNAYERARVDSVIGEWSDVDRYLPKVNAPGSRIGSYREGSDGGGHTCAAFLGPLPGTLRGGIAAFRDAVEGALPGRYTWLGEGSLHCTLRSLDPI